MFVPADWTPCSRNTHFCIFLYSKYRLYISLPLLIAQYCHGFHQVVIDFTTCHWLHKIVVDFTMLSRNFTQVQRCRNKDIARTKANKKVAEKVEPKMQKKTQRTATETSQNQTPNIYDCFGDMELQFRWRKTCDIAVLTQQVIETILTVTIW